MQPEDDAGLAPDLLLAVRVDQEGECRSIGTGRRLDDPRQELLLGRRVEVLEILAGVLRVLRQVEVAPVVDALELLPAEREAVLEVDRLLGIVGQLVGPVLARADPRRGHAQALVPGTACGQPRLEGLGDLGRLLVGHEAERDLHVALGGDDRLHALAAVADVEADHVARRSRPRALEHAAPGLAVDALHAGMRMRDVVPSTVTWWAGASSWNVSHRPHVRSTSWSSTTKVPGWSSGCSEPAEHGATRLRTPSSLIAHTLAR